MLCRSQNCLPEKLFTLHTRRGRVKIVNKGLQFRREGIPVRAAEVGERLPGPWGRHVEISERNQDGEMIGVQRIDRGPEERRSEMSGDYGYIWG